MKKEVRSTLGTGLTIIKKGRRIRCYTPEELVAYDKGKMLKKRLIYAGVALLILSFYAVMLNAAIKYDNI